MNLHLLLEQAGLTHNESRAYLALLHVGKSTVGPILKESGMNSGKIYELLESLKTKGLISETVQNGTRMFQAGPPKQLLAFTQRRKEEIDRQEQELTKALPLLEALREEQIPQKAILTYTGRKGIETAALEALADEPENSEIVSFPIHDKNGSYQPFWKRWEQLRLAKNITARYLLAQQGIVYNDLKGIKLMQLRLLPMDTPTGVDVYGESKVLILHYVDPPTCTLIYDEATAKTFKEYFEVLWKQGKEPSR